MLGAGGPRRVPVVHAGCWWCMPDAGGPRWVLVAHARCWCGEVLHGVMVVAREQWAPVRCEAAFNPILPTWPRPQEEPSLPRR